MNGHINRNDVDGTVLTSSPTQILTSPEDILKTDIIREEICIRNLGPVRG